MTTAAPPKPPTAKAPPPPPPSRQQAPARQFKPQSGIIQSAQRVGIYGPGGIGKSSLLASMIDIGRRPQIIDLDDGTKDLNVARISDVETFGELRAILADDALWKDFQVVGIDSLTKAEELAVSHTLATVPHEKGYPIKRIEDYGFGKGLQHVYDSFLPLLGDLDRHIRAGRDVVIICHECTANVPNPAGEDFIRYEPRLQSPNSGKSSIRYRIKEWLDHLFFVGYDVNATKDGKGQGCGTRTIYCQEMPTHWAKSRRLSESVSFAKDDMSQIWKQLFSIGE